MNLKTLSHLPSNIEFSIKSIIWLIVMTLGVISALQWYTLGTQNPPILNVILFTFLLFSGSIKPIFALSAFIIISPALIGLESHLNSQWPGLNIHISNSLFVDALNGMNLSFLINFLRQKQTFSLWLPNKPGVPILLVMFTLMAVTELVLSALTITQNINYSASTFSIKGFIFNLLYSPKLDWFHDYLSLQQALIMFASCTSLFLCSIFMREKAFSRATKHALAVSIFTTLCYGIFTRIVEFGHYSYIDRRWAINSYLPDLHAFASICSAAAIGCFFSCIHGKRLRILRGVFLLGAILVLIISGSRSTMLVVTFFLIALGFNQIRGFFSKEKADKKTATKNLLVFITIFAVAIVFSTIDSSRTLKFQYVFSMIDKGGFVDFDKAMSYRPGIYLSALIIWLSYPALGIGINNFYRFSSDPNIIKNQYLNTAGGENVHSYLLQILVEKGILGLTIFCALIFFFLRFSQIKKEPLMFGFFVGLAIANIFSHSLLLSNIWYLFVLILTYLAVASGADILKFEVLQNFYAKKHRLILSALLIFASLFVLKKWSHKPISDGHFCHKNFHDADGFIGGKFSKKLEKSGENLSLQVSAANPDIAIRPVKISYSIIHNNKLLFSQHITAKNHAPIHLKTPLKDIPKDSSFFLQLQTSHCFTPINSSINTDNRRLGLKLHSYTMK